MMRGTLPLGLLLVLSTLGCQSPTQPPAAQRSEPAARPSTAQSQPQETSTDASGNEETGSAGRVAGVRRNRRRWGNSTSTC